MYVKFVGIHAPLKLTASAFMKWNEISLFLAMPFIQFQQHPWSIHTTHFILFYFYKKVDSTHNNDNYNRNFFI